MTPDMKVIEKVVLPILERALEPDSGRFMLVRAAVREIRELLGIKAPMSRQDVERVAHHCKDLEYWIRKGAGKCGLEESWDGHLVDDVHGGVEPGQLDEWTGADWLTREAQLQGYRRYYHGYITGFETAKLEVKP